MRGPVAAPGYMTPGRIFVELLLILLCASACVTQTKRMGYYPYARQGDDSIQEELRREFRPTSPRRPSEEPFYKKAVREVKETVSGWFHEEEDTQLTDAQKLKASRRQFEQERQEAFRHLHEQQELEELLHGK
jgi:hypothetical protein